MVEVKMEQEKRRRVKADARRERGRKGRYEGGN